MEAASIDRLGELWLPYGALGAAAVLLGAVLVRRPAPGDLAFVGGLVAGTTAGWGDLPDAIVVGLAGLAAVTWVSHQGVDSSLARAGFEAGGALVALFTVGLRGWVLVLCSLAVPVVAAALGAVDERRAGLGALLLAVSVIGAWTTLPDTEEATALLGAAIVVVVVGVVVPLRSGGVGAVLGATAVMLAVGVGGLGRDGAVVGAALAVLAVGLEPLVRAWTGRRNHVAVVVLTHVALVGVVCRVAGLRESAIDAALLGGSGALLAAGVLLVAPTGGHASVRDPG